MFHILIVTLVAQLYIFDKTHQTVHLQGDFSVYKLYLNKHTFFKCLISFTSDWEIEIKTRLIFSPISLANIWNIDNFQEVCLYDNKVVGKQTLSYTLWVSISINSLESTSAIRIKILKKAFPSTQYFHIQRKT